MKRAGNLASILVCFALLSILCRSCANTTTPPSGGPKDTIPPVLLSITPPNGTTGFPRTDGKITLLFDEYTVVKSAADMMISPPVKKKPIAKVKGKNIVVTLQDTLAENTTYAFDFGNSLADNNEGNLAPRMVYTFSTGDVIDSMYFTGSLRDNNTLAPVKKALVALYKVDRPDSAVFLTTPDAVTLSDDWGFFVFRNIRDTTYRIYAYTDEDADYKYNPNEAYIGFADSVITPVKVVNDSIYELGSFEMKDTLACKKRTSDITLNMFKELQTIQYLQNSGRKTAKAGYLKFSAADVQINSLEFVGIDPSSVIIQYNNTRDSLDFWLNVDYKLEDSLMVKLNYMKTDSTGVLSPFTENLSLAIDKPKDSNTPQIAMKKGADKKKKSEKDTVFKLTTTSSDETVESDGVRLESALPVIQIVQDSISLTEKNPKGQESVKTFTFKQDTADIRRFIIIPAEKMIKGYEYTLKIPQGTFINLDKLPNAAVDIKFQIPQSEELSTLTLDVRNVNTCYIIELTDEKGSTLRKNVVIEDKTIEIPYLKQGKYKIRLTQDGNRNGYPDTGNLLEHRQPETVRFFETSPDQQLLEIPPASEVEQTLDILKIFQ